MRTATWHVLHGIRLNPRMASRVAMSWTAIQERWSTSRSGPVLRGTRDWSPLSNRAFPDTDNYFNKWAGVQGTVSGVLPDESARWSGLMLGYQGRTCCRRDPVRGGPREHPILPIRQ